MNKLERFVVFTPIEKDYDKVVLKLKNKGLGWKHEKHPWETRKKKTVIYIDMERKEFECSTIDTWKRDWFEEYPKIELSDYLKREPKSLPTKYLVIWQPVDDPDPVERFTTKKEAYAKARELAKDDKIILESIEIYEVKSMATVELKVSIKTSK